jgi:AraC-like DNA-binding protein
MTAASVYSGPQWQRFAIYDIDETYTFVRQAFFDVKARFSEHAPDSGGLLAITARLDDIGLTRMRFSPRTQLTAAPDGDVNITHLIRGRNILGHGKDGLHFAPGDNYLIAPGHRQDFDFADIDLFTVRLPRALLEDVAHTQTGIRGADLRFVNARPITARLGRHWSQTVSHVTNTVLSDAALTQNPLIVAQARHLLAATALTVFSNTSLDAYYRRAGDVAPSALRRAMAHAEANAERPITVADMAAAAGITTRALQAGFRRHRDTTPLRYARTVRLERAHHDLQAADPTTGVTVAMIATRWGFTHPGRFSTDYRAAYGVSPSHTLRT